MHILIFLKQIFFECRDNILRELLGIRKSRPLMKYRESEIIREIIINKKPALVLEWGSGFSTLYFPEYMNKNFSWISIEHDRDWAAKIRHLNKRSNVEIINIPPDNYPWTDRYNDGAYTDLKTYITYPEKYSKFDIIIIDGRGRGECLKKSLELINKNGIVIFHDSNRKHFQEHLGLYKYSLLLTDYRDFNGGLWIAGNDIEISDLISAETYKKVWKLYNKKLAFFFKIFNHEI